MRIRVGLILCGWVWVVLGAGAAERSLVVDRALSTIEIDVKATVGSFVGHLADYEVSLTVDDTGAQVGSAEMRFQFADVKTGEDKRDRKMHQWQETERYPDGRFLLHSLQPNAAGELEASGELTFHGQTHPLSFPVVVQMEDETVVIDGEAIVDTEQFGLPIIRLLFALKVDPAVTVRFHLHATYGHPA